MSPVRYFVLLLYVALFAGCNSTTESFIVEKQPLTVSVYASASVQAKDQYKVYSLISGIVKQVLVHEGDSVEADQTIIMVENSKPALNSENALLQLNLAKENLQGSSSRLESLQLQINVAKQRAQEDSLNYERQKTLWSQQIGSKLDLENKSMAFENSRSNYLQLKKQKTLLTKELSIALKQAENNYQISVKNKGDFEIRSLLNGKVYAVYKEVGELVNLQEPVALIGDAKEFVLEMDIDQQDINSVLNGQKVILRMDAFGEQIFEAHVIKIYPLMNERTQTVKVEAKFNQILPNLFPGMSGEANIVVNEQAETLTIPLNYLIEDSFVITKNKEKTFVKTGLRSLGKVEIIEGLNEGDEILKPEL